MRVERIATLIVAMFGAVLPHPRAVLDGVGGHNGDGTRIGDLSEGGKEGGESNSDVASRS